MTFQRRRAFHIGGASWLLLCATGNGAMAEDAAPTPSSATQLPEISVTAPRISQAPRRPKKRVLTGERRPPPAAAPQTEAQSRSRARTTNSTRRARTSSPRSAPANMNSTSRRIEALPQGTNTHAGQGVAAGARRHRRTRPQAANCTCATSTPICQYRINGIMLPDGVGAFGQILDTGIVGSLSLLTGALPAQYGLRTSGVLDIQTKTDAFNNSRQRQRLWRQSRNDHAEFRIWRHGRTNPVFRIRTLFRQQSGNRKSDAGE